MKNKKLIIIIVSVVLVVAVLTTVLCVSFCNKPDGGTSSGSSSSNVTYYDNENDPLIFSSQAVDKVFNPFFSTAAADSSVVGMTQIGMLSNDKDGKPVYGDDEAVVTKDLQIVTEGIENVDQTTTYYFVLKNNVRFSNGSYLTMKDVLFNLYVYLDPAYTGSSTIYSTDIVGLQEYRTQTENETEQDNFLAQFRIAAEARMLTLIDACKEIIEDHEDENAEVFSDNFRDYLAEYKSLGADYEKVLEDYDRAITLFNEELETDWTNSLDAYEDTIFTDEDGEIHRNLFTTDVESFLYNYGYITWNKKEGKLQSSLANDPASLKNWTKEQAISTVLEDKIPFDIEEVLTWWNTATKLSEYIANEAMGKYFENGANRRFDNISGIKFANRTSPVTVNGVTYQIPTYNDDGSVKEGNEVLSITINDIDPKAIWNFSFGVAPMYYYSDAAHIEKFDYEKNFGVEYASQEFMTTVVKSPDKIGVPVGAGAYAASRSSGGIENVTADQFYELGVIYYERNPYFVLGAPTIKKVRYQVISDSQLLNALYTGTIHYVTPNAKLETKNELEAKKDQGFGVTSVKTSGYGYIGVNAGKVPDMEVRQAIMHSINTQECVNYYKTTAEAIHRPMSTASWAYPKGSTPYYPYIGGPVPENLAVVNPAYAEYVTSLGKTAGSYLTEEEQNTFIKQLVESAGYTLNANGVYVKGSNVLKYTFTIAGEETDHPAFDAMYHAREKLNKVGFEITVQPDANALKKLSDGSLSVWAAAWGSTIDPDMYQVYHKDSKATSTTNWGYKQILNNAGGKYDREKALVEQLSELIEKGRETNDEKQRARIYAQALDLVMQLAVELPTYQRNDLFAYNTKVIDESTLMPYEELSPFNGLTSELWNISLVTER